MSEQTLANPPFAPRTRSEAAKPRKDPEVKSLVGLPLHGIQIVNRDSKRAYVMIEKGAGQGRELISPDMYMEMGWQIERWGTPEEIEGGIKPKFRGAPLGRPGEQMERFGHVLMSMSLEDLRIIKAQQQAYIDPLEKAVTSPSLATKKANEALEESEIDGDHMYAEAWNGRSRG